MLTQRDKEVYLAELAAQAERYDEACEHMKRVVLDGSGLSTSERNLLSVAYKNKVGVQRNAWRTTSSVLAGCDGEEATYAEEYLKKAKEEGIRSCEEVIDLLESHLIPKATEKESKCFFLKMRADYLRYMAELAEDPKFKDMAAEAYAEAVTSEEHLPPTNPIRLGMALSRAVFNYEILQRQAEAITIARKAFDEGLAALDDIPEEHYKDAVTILQIIRDNLNVWTTEC
ncbi:unnamed protein product [Effrenium voratum]|nr:unnamed protein product [Effrenium voratum]CAJ1414994.1 unnamed protein product [Effrenium voratum]